MDVIIHPHTMQGEITPPPSKSYLHRAIICASLAKGKSVIKNILIGDDIQQTIEAFRSLGVHIEYLDNQLIIESTGKLLFKDNHIINCHESGSTIRFLMPLLSNDMGVEFHGEPSLLNRPLDFYEHIFSKQNNTFVRFSDYIYTEGKIKPDHYLINDDSSSQYISGLLFTLPLLKDDSSIEIKKNFQSKNYIDMTIYILKQFGIKIIKEKENLFIIPGNQVYKSTHIEIEADFSQAAFFIAGALINGNIKLNNLNIDSLQPDQHILEIIRNAGGQLDYINNQVIVKKSNLSLSFIDLSQIIDLGPILFLLASQSLTPTKIINYERLVHKESNRLKNMLLVLDKMNVKYEKNDHQLIIHRQPTFDLKSIDSYNDHRIAMSIAIFATISNTPTLIKNMEVINKSYPTFLIDLENLGIKIDYLS